MIKDNFENFAQSLRIFLESSLQFPARYEIDVNEAISNLELSFDSILQNFHSLIDSTKKEGVNENWYELPELSTILLLRNGKHHNLSNKIRNLFKYHKQVYGKESHKYLTVDFVPREEGARTLEYFVSWYDYAGLFDLAPSETKIKGVRKEQVFEYLGAEKMIKKSAQLGYQEEDIFINFIPLVINAGIKIYPYIQDNIDVNISTESDYFNTHFKTVEPCQANVHKFEEIEFKPTE